MGGNRPNNCIQQGQNINGGKDPRSIAHVTGAPHPPHSARVNKTPNPVNSIATTNTTPKKFGKQMQPQHKPQPPMPGKIDYSYFNT